MAKEKKLVEAITPMEQDFAQWYTDVVVKAELIDISSTDIRRRIREGRSIRQLVPRAVADMIKRNGYYA